MELSSALTEELESLYNHSLPTIMNELEYHIPGQPTDVQKRTLGVLQSPSITGLA